MKKSLEQGLGAHRSRHRGRLVLVAICWVPGLFLTAGCGGGKTTVYREPHPKLDTVLVEEFLEAVDDGRYGDLHSTLVIIDGVPVFEAYFNGHRADDRAPLYSVTKSFVSALIGIAIEEGAISSVDESVFASFAEHQNLALRDPRKLRLTIRHLLSMTAGFEWDELSAPYNSERNDYRRFVASSDRIAFTLGLPLRDEPGETVTYCSPLSQVLSCILTRTTGMSAAEFAETRLFAPLGIDDWWWAEYDEQTSVGEAGLYLRTADMAKLGQLYLQGGEWDGEQVVNSIWVDASIMSRGAVDQWNDYGYNWWLYNEAAAKHHLDGHEDIYYAVGRGGQFVWVLPFANAVIACTGWNDNNGYWPESMLSDFFLSAIDR